MTLSQIISLVERQRACWPLAAQNYQALEQVETRTFTVDGVTIRAQFNPARIASSGAKVDRASLEKRPCFLCPDHLPQEQIRVPYGTRYQLLVNPFPIFREHLTIPAIEHAPQRILSRMDDLLALARDLSGLTLFYNGPSCGASAPDHAHFQAVTRGVMPIDRELSVSCPSVQSLLEMPAGGKLYAFTRYLRNGFLIQATQPEEARTLFQRLYHTLPVSEEEAEPKMNLFCSYQNGCWQLVVIPRKRHRPWQYEAEGEQRLLSSPGAADVGGLFIAARREDFEKLTPDLLRDVYQQVCLSDGEIGQIVRELMP